MSVIIGVGASRLTNVTPPRNDASTTSTISRSPKMAGVESVTRYSE